MTDVFCKDCKWLGTGHRGSLGNGTICHHPASLVTGPDLVTGLRWDEGYLTAEVMRSGRPDAAWRQTYCGLDGTLFEPLEASGGE